MKNTKQQKQCKWRMSAVSALIYYIYIYTQREFWDYIIPINLMWLVVLCLVFILNAKSELRHSLKLTHTYINKNLSPPMALQWRHNERDGVSNHQPQECLRNRFFRRRSKKTSKLRVTGLFAGNSPVAGEFPAQSSSNAENVSIWWRHHI